MGDRLILDLAAILSIPSSSHPSHFRPHAFFYLILHFHNRNKRGTAFLFNFIIVTSTLATNFLGLIGSIDSVSFGQWRR